MMVQRLEGKSNIILRTMDIKLVANSGQEGEGKGSNPFTKTDDSPI